MVKVKTSEQYRSTHQNLSSNNWMELDHQDQKSSTKRDDPVVQNELQKHVSPKQLKEVTKDEIELQSKNNDIKSDEYEDDFEDYYSEENNKTEKEYNSNKFAHTTEFSLGEIDYEKIREDLSDYSLLLLKNTATSEEVNRKGILEKKT